MKITRSKQFKIELNLIHCLSSNGFIPLDQDLKLLFDDLGEHEILEFESFLQDQPQLADIPKNELVQNCRVLFSWSGDCVDRLPINTVTLERILNRESGSSVVDRRILAAKMSKIASFGWDSVSNEEDEVEVKGLQLWWGLTRTEPNVLVRNSILAVLNTANEEVDYLDVNDVTYALNKHAKFIAGLQFADIPQ